MEILRVPPYPLVTTWDVPDADTSYTLELEDLVDHSVQSYDVTSDSDAVITHEIPQDLVMTDRSFGVRIYTDADLVAVDTNLEIYRPYVDPSTLGTTASEIEEYKTLELVSRAIIDEFIGGGFYNKKEVLQGVGMGTDYYPVWKDVNKIIKVYENDVLVYDANAEDPTTNIYEYAVLSDRTAIYRVSLDSMNRSESAPVVLPSSRGDLWSGTATGNAFQKSFDYTFILEVGPKSVPADVEYATKLLIDDIKCGRLDYYKRYMASYSTDQFKIGFASRMFDGTGNMIVDKILKKYETTIQRLGVL